MKLYEAIAYRVKKLLDEKDMKQYSLYKKGGISRSTISALVNCKIKNVSTDLVYQICATLEIPLKDFYDDAIFEKVDD